MDTEIFGPLEFSLTQSMVEGLKDEDDDILTPFFFRFRVPSLLVSSSSQQASKKDRSTLIHSLVPLSVRYKGVRRLGRYQFFI